jgi:serine protease
MKHRLEPRALMAGLAVSLLASCGGSGSSGTATDPEGTALAGVIDIEAGTRVDVDNADAIYLGATLAGTPQVLPQAFILAGYVSGASGAYEPLSGLSLPYFSDETDQFRLRLAPGQRVALQAFATRAGRANLTLTLSDVDSGAVLATAETSPTSSQIGVTVPDDQPAADYLVTVQAQGTTPMLYILSSSLADEATALVFDWPDFPFVPGQALMTLDSPRARVAGASDMEPVRELAPGHWQVRRSAASRVAEAEDTLAWIRGLRARSGVRRVIPDYRTTALATPLDEPLYADAVLGQRWHYELINLPLAWQLAPEAGAGVTVAVLDTGLYAGTGGWHQDLRPNVIEGYDFVSGDLDTDTSPGRDSDPTDPGNAIGGSVYHGTHVAGTVAAADNDLGGIGVAYGASLMPVRVLGEGGTGASGDLLAALSWVNGDDSGTPRAQVVNLSLGGLPYIEALADVISEGAGRGVIYVAAAGNSASTEATYPAAFEHVLAVSAVDGAGALASYSNHGGWVDLAAPGGDLTRDANADGRADALGWGVIDAAQAVLAATDSSALDLMTASPAVASLSSERQPSVSVVLAVYGEQAEAVTIQSVALTPEVDWVTGSGVAAGDSGTRFTLELALVPDALAEGSAERTTLQVTYLGRSGSRTLEIPVIGQQLADQALRDAGRHFALLVNPEAQDGAYETVAQAALEVVNGQYRFRFYHDDGEAPRYANEVPEGRYFLVAGSDLDNDGRICHSGEACAEYPVAGLREEVTVTAGQALTNLQLTTSYARPTISAATPDILPRPDFPGYRLLDVANGTSSMKQLSEP